MRWFVNVIVVCYCGSVTNRSLQICLFHTEYVVGNDLCVVPWDDVQNPSVSYRWQLPYLAGEPMPKRNLGWCQWNSLLSLYVIRQNQILLNNCPMLTPHQSLRDSFPSRGSLIPHCQAAVRHGKNFRFCKCGKFVGFGGFRQTVVYLRHILKAVPYNVTRIVYRNLQWGYGNLIVILSGAEGF